MTNMHNSIKLRRAAELILQADSLLITAGAGMGIDSGLPDFRGNEGFWQAYPALGRQGIGFQEIASPKSFFTMPTRAWGFYGHRLELYRHTIPHQGFQLLKTWGERRELGYSIFTSNVDGQFQKAGFSPEKIHECHGSIHHFQCVDTCNHSTWEADYFIPKIDIENGLLTNALPVCPHCSAIARPNILMFNDSYWLEKKYDLQSAHQQSWLESTKKPVIIELGAGPTISTVRNFSDRTARRFNGNLIRINPTHPNVSHPSDISLPLGALEALRVIDTIINGLSE